MNVDRILTKNEVGGAGGGSEYYTPPARTPAPAPGPGAAGGAGGGPRGGWGGGLEGGLRRGCFRRGECRGSASPDQTDTRNLVFVLKVGLRVSLFGKSGDVFSLPLLLFPEFPSQYNAIASLPNVIPVSPLK